MVTLSMQMDPGEAAALALAADPGWGLVADDRRARRGAERLGVPVTGTLGVLLLAWRRGLVEAPVAMARQLRRNGLWLSDDLIDGLRKQVER